MKRHNRQGKPRTDLKPFVCTHCQEGNCDSCIDIGRVMMVRVADFVPICKCKTPGHDGEPVDQQVKDPFTGTVHAPGLEVSEDGTVTKRNPELSE